MDGPATPWLCSHVPTLHARRAAQPGPRPPANPGCATPVRIGGAGALQFCALAPLSSLSPRIAQHQGQGRPLEDQGQHGEQAQAAVPCGKQAFGGGGHGGGRQGARPAGRRRRRRGCCFCVCVTHAPHTPRPSGARIEGGRADDTRAVTLGVCVCVRVCWSLFTGARAPSFHQARCTAELFLCVCRPASLDLLSPVALSAKAPPPHARRRCRTTTSAHTHKLHTHPFSLSLSLLPFSLTPRSLPPHTRNNTHTHTHTHTQFFHPLPSF